MPEHKDHCTRFNSVIICDDLGENQNRNSNQDKNAFIKNRNCSISFIHNIIVFDLYAYWVNRHKYVWLLKILSAISRKFRHTVEPWLSTLQTQLS